MSFTSMSWAVNQDCKSSSSKLVLLLLASHMNSLTGQCNPSHKTLAQECNMSVSSIKTHLKKLEKLGLIKISQKFSNKINLSNNYELIELSESENRGQNLTEEGANFDSGRGQNLTTKQEDIKQEYKLKNTLSAKQVCSACDSEKSEDDTLVLQGKKYSISGKRATTFLEFWEKFAYKRGRAEAIDEWSKLVLTNSIFKTIMNGVNSELEARQLGKIPKMPQNWLSSRRWEDEDVSFFKANNSPFNVNKLIEKENISTDYNSKEENNSANNVFGMSLNTQNNRKNYFSNNSQPSLFERNMEKAKLALELLA